MESQLINTGIHLSYFNHKSQIQKYLLTPFSYKIATLNTCQIKRPILKSNTMGATSGAGTAYLSRVPKYTPGF